MGWCTEKIEQMNEASNILAQAMHDELCKPLAEVNTDELGKVSDILKDVNQAQYHCYKAWYYCQKIHEDTPMSACVEHYDGFKSSENIQEQTAHIYAYEEAVADAMREMYHAASSEAKKKLKADLTKLVSEMV